MFKRKQKSTESRAQPMPSSTGKLLDMNKVLDKGLSSGVSNKSFQLTDLSRYGVSGGILCMAFDPIQSLLAISTGKGEVHVFGQKKVEVAFVLESSLQLITLKFVKGIYLVAIDAKSTIFVFSLHSKKLLYTYSAPGIITSVETDYSLEFLIIGLQNGSCIFYDISIGKVTPYRIGNLQRKVLPSIKYVSPVLSVKWHPRDIGTVLIAYSHVSVIYSFVTDEIKQEFIYKPQNGQNVQLVTALWHPNGLNIVTLYDDNSFVFWDSNDGTILQARTLYDTYINQSTSIPDTQGLSPIIKISWICAKDPEHTQLVICGGDTPEKLGAQNLTLLDFGQTPKYSVTSYESMGKYYAFPKSQRVMPIHNSTAIIDFLPLGEASPYFGGNHDPRYILVLSDSGDLKLVSFPLGTINYEAGILPPTLTWMNPKISCSRACPVPRSQWLGMLSVSTASKVRPLLKGGSSQKKSGSAYSLASALITGHENGFIRMWDASSGELDVYSLLEIDLTKILQDDSNDVTVTNVSFAADTAELAVSTLNGHVLLFKFAKNYNYNSKVSDLNQRFKSMNLKHDNKDPNSLSAQILNDISDRTPLDLKEGFLPVSYIRKNSGKVTSLINSNVGFVGICYESGELMIIDRRGPSILFSIFLSELCEGTPIYGTCLEVGVMALNEDTFSSLVLLLGTNRGDLLRFQITPSSNGSFQVKFYDIFIGATNGPLCQLTCIDRETGAFTIATLGHFKKLSNGVVIRSLIIASSNSDIRILDNKLHRVTHKTIKSGVTTCGVSVIPNSNQGSSPVFNVLSKSNDIKVYSLPSLREITTLILPYPVSTDYLAYSSVIANGEILVRINESEAGLVDIVGHSTAELSPTRNIDQLFNDSLIIPYRPTVNTVQYLKRGTKLISYQDLIQLMYGGNVSLRNSTPDSELAFQISPYNPNNQGVLNSMVNSPLLKSPSKFGEEGGSQDEEFNYNKPIRKHHVATVNPLKQAYRSIQSGIESLDEAGNDYASNFKEGLNSTIGEAQTGILKAGLRSKLGW
ncbi:hypothetical protein LJB42_002350 [Komagataella kurtzmanii]|nr:hypothetical protein LJB42_002350 [Komagataella kurtzmanii]